MQYQNRHLKNLIYAAVFASFICIATMFLKFTLPAAGGYFHVGDSFIFLCAVCIPFPFAGIAAGIGSSLADLLSGYGIYAVPTFLIKFLITLSFSHKYNKIINKRNIFAIVAAAVILNVGYYFTEAVLTKNLIGAAVSFYGNIIQAAAGTVIFLFTAFWIDKYNLREKLF